MPVVPLGVGLLQQQQQTFMDGVGWGDTETATLLARDSNFLYLWNGFYFYVSEIVYS
jgi:hypothetical protein